MNMHEALDYIRDNSILLVDMPTSGTRGFEFRKTNAGNPFVLNDMGVNGWAIYVPVAGNSIDNSIEAFNAINKK